MSWIWKILLFFAGEYLKGKFVSRAKRKGAIAYLHALQGTRQLAIALVLAFFLFHAVLLAGFGTLVTGMMLLDLERKTMLQILFGIFLGLFLLPVVALLIGLSERLWYRVSGAEKMVDELREPRGESKAA